MSASSIATQARRTVAFVFGAAAVIEFAVSFWVLVVGPFNLHLGVVPILGRTATKPFVVGVMLSSLALLLVEPLRLPAPRSRLARASDLGARAAVLLSMVPLVVPIFLPNFLIGHDGGVHQTYAFLFNRALVQGQLPVRWVEGITDGLGQPLFNYYQVGFYYLVALIHRCGPSLSLALKLTIAGQWALGGAFMFLLCRPFGTLPAMMGAAVFVWSPYLLLDAYVRTAYPEMTAIAFAPGVLWSLDRVLRTGRPIFMCALAFTTGMLIISHLPTAVIVAPLAAAYLMGSWIVHRRPAYVVGRAVTGALIGAGLAAFYVLPALLELNAIGMSGMTAGYFDYHRHFVRPAWWFNWSWGYAGSGTSAPDQMSQQIGIAQWIVLAAALVVLAVPGIRRQAAPHRMAIAGWLLSVAIALFMMTAASTPVWDTVRPLAFIQFPWRVLMLPALACGVLSAILLSVVRHRTMQALAVLCVVVLQWYVTLDYRAQARTRERGTITIDDPAWAHTTNAMRWAFRESAYDPLSVTAGSHPSAARWTVSEGRAKVSALSVTDAQLRLEVDASESLLLVINSPFFPGWRISVDGQAISPAIQQGTGYQQVRIPVGVHVVDAVFGNSRVRTLADATTVFSFFGALALALWEVRRGPARSAPGFAVRPGRVG